MRVAAVFSDYDGTLAPDWVPREESRIPSELDRELRALAGRVPFAIITSKDRSFIMPRVPYARAWSCVCGLEVQLSDGSLISTPPLPHSDEVLENIRTMIAGRLILEEKCGVRGVLGFSVDWRSTGAPPGPLLEKVLDLRSRGFQVSYNPGYPFADVFFGPADKSNALTMLKRRLRVDGPVMFIGDSPADNSAFREADVSVGVSHGQPIEKLECEYLVNWSDLTDMLSWLSRGAATFPIDVPGIRRV